VAETDQSRVGMLVGKKRSLRRGSAQSLRERGFTAGFFPAKDHGIHLFLRQGLQNAHHARAPKFSRRLMCKIWK